jgi:hypothetical protein
MSDLTCKYTDELVGSGHPTKEDTINRMPLVEHNTDGTHKYAERMFDINVFLTPLSQVNWDHIYQDDGTLSLTYNARLESTGAQNASISWPLTLAAGTYAVSLMHHAGPDRGIYSVQIDGVEKGTINGYAGAAIQQVDDATGIVIADTGEYTLTLKMAAKDASSSGYAGMIQALRVIRTA